MDNRQRGENPFAGILASLQGGGQQMPQQPPQPMAGQQMMPGGQPMGGEDMMGEENQLMKGKGAGNSQFLLGAVQQLQRYITNSTDPAEIQIARNVVILLNRLMEKEQKTMAGKIGEDSQMMQTAMPPQR